MEVKKNLHDTLCKNILSCTPGHSLTGANMTLSINEHVLHNQNMDWTDKILVSWIESFAIGSVLDKPKYLASQLNIPINKVKYSVVKLKNLGYLSTTLRDGERFVFSKRIYLSG